MKHFLFITLTISIFSCYPKPFNEDIIAQFKTPDQIIIITEKSKKIINNTDKNFLSAKKIYDSFKIELSMNNNIILIEDKKTISLIMKKNKNIKEIIFTFKNKQNFKFTKNEIYNYNGKKYWITASSKKNKDYSYNTIKIKNNGRIESFIYFCKNKCDQTPLVLLNFSGFDYIDNILK
jgi:hypothetical protein